MGASQNKDASVLSPTATELLIVSATHAEAASVPKDLQVLICGIGKSAAATALATTLSSWPTAVLPHVVNIGTAGALRSGLTGLYFPSRVINHEMNTDILTQMGVAVTSAYDVPEGDDTVLATGDIFVHDVDLRHRLAQNAHLVDMEGFSLAHVCAVFGTPLRIVKHVSDNANEESIDWPSRIAYSAHVLGQWLQEKYLS